MPQKSKDLLQIIMSENKFLNGQLLISQPNSKDKYFSKSVILVAQHSTSGAWGVVLNRQAKTVTLSGLMNAVGMNYSPQTPVYVGGPVEPTRVHVVHSLDWASPSTLEINNEIGITGDMSVFAAICANTGPKNFRVGFGLSAWTAGQLEGEQSGAFPWNKEHQWLTVPATLDLCLSGTAEQQWIEAITASIEYRVSNIF